MIKSNKRIWITAIILAVFFTGVGMASAAEEVQQQTYVPKTIVDVPWGDKPEEFGILNAPEIERIGPKFFTVERKGNIYVFDTWKKHIKKFDKDGNYIGNIGSDLPTGSSIIVGTNGHIFLLRGHLVDEYLQNGRLLKTHEISRDISLIQGYGQGLKLDDIGNIYVKSLYHFFNIGKIVRGQFEALSYGNQKASKQMGLPGIRSNIRIMTRIRNKKSAFIQMLDENGKTIKEIPMYTGGTFASAYFTGQDKYGYIYAETGIMTGDIGHFEIKKYDENGSLISVMELPSNYYTLTNNIVEIDAAGNIYQLLTVPKGVQIIKWEQK